MQKIISQIVESYRFAFLFCLAAVPLLCIPIFFEGLQHAAEVWLGMFAEGAAENFDNEDQIIRLIFGVLKVLSIVVIYFLVPRFFLHGRSVKKALSFSSKAKMAICLGFLTMIAIVVWVFILGPNTVAMVHTGASSKQKMLIPLVIVLLLGFPLQNRMNKWMAQVFDDTPLKAGENAALNKALKGGLSPVIVLSILPMMIVHYGLNIWAMGKSLGLIIFVLGIDSLLVGLLGVLMGATTYVVYRDARQP